MSGRAEPASNDAAPAPATGRRNLLVIYNPVAGRRQRRRFRKTLRELARRGCVVTVRETMGSGEARTFAAEAAGEGFDAIVVAGGDGTVNEVAGALVGTAEELCVVPLGTANVVAAEIGLPARPRAVQLARMVMDGPAQTVHLGRVGERHFLSMAGAGLDARVVAHVSLGLKRLIGKAAYVWATFAELAKKQDEMIELTLDGTKVRAAAAIVANGHFYGGRFVVAREARLSEPVLHVALFERPGRLRALGYALALALGGLEKARGFRIERVEAGSFDGPDGQPIQADGDLSGTTPQPFRVAARTLNLVMPE